MRRILLLIAAVVAGSTGLSFAIARWVAAQRPAPPVVRLHDTTWLTRELKLNKEQSSAVARLEAEFKMRLDAMCAAHCAARFALGDELMKANVDVEKCKACVEKMNAAQAEAEHATLAHILKVRAVLSDEQVKHYSALIHDQVCNMPMGAP
ncbi:MAG TPA: periplasmic heavy metal sensor [Verrucomicrobiae bacterium]|nr:periplasmic heavy metal sensor [Verrucomicrobiae bacterium]